MQSNGAQCICWCAASVVRWPDTGGPLLLLLLLLLLLYFYCSFCYTAITILFAMILPLFWLLLLCYYNCALLDALAVLISLFPYSQVYKEGGHLCFVLGCFIDLLCKALYKLVYHAVVYNTLCHMLFIASLDPVIPNYHWRVPITTATYHYFHPPPQCAYVDSYLICPNTLWSRGSGCGMVLGQIYDS